MATDQNRFREFALRWRNHDPDLYEHFLKFLDAYVFEVTVAVTEASSSEILQAQGRAQMARKFLQLFSETATAQSSPVPTQGSTPWKPT